MFHKVHHTDKLFTSSFIFASLGNFLLFMGFYLLMPVLPLYLIDAFGTPKSEIGLILASYTVAALAIRPFSGFLLDMFRRKPIYLLAYAFVVVFNIGYPLAQSILLFLLLRILHGLAFGMVTTAGNTLIVDIMPSSRRGEGLGYFGVANNLAMAIGPMTGLMLHEYYGSWNVIFMSAVGCGLLGFFFATRIKTTVKPKSVREPLSFDRFFLLKGWKAGLCLLLLAIPYGMTTTYMALYAEEVGVSGNMGLFFSLMALGLIVSRTFAGSLVDKGKITQVIQTGAVVAMIAFFVFSSVGFFKIVLGGDLARFGFYMVALLLGVGYGMLFPAYNTLFVDLAPHNRRATASSTYLTSWDVGIGLGLVLGGNIGELGGFKIAYLMGAIFVTLSVVLFAFVAAPHFQRNKFR
jgi:MFS family permease